MIPNLSSSRSQQLFLFIYLFVYLFIYLLIVNNKAICYKWLSVCEIRILFLTAVENINCWLYFWSLSNILVNIFIASNLHCKPDGVDCERFMKKYWSYWLWNNEFQIWQLKVLFYSFIPIIYLFVHLCIYICSKKKKICHKNCETKSTCKFSCVSFVVKEILQESVR